MFITLRKRCIKSNKIIQIKHSDLEKCKILPIRNNTSNTTGLREVN